MKKVLLVTIIFFITIGNSYGYNLNSKDNKLLNTIYKKIDLIFDKYPYKIENLYEKIGKIKKKVRSKKRIYAILIELENYSYKLLNNRNSNNYFVKKVVDGDTIKINSLGKYINVRLIGIDSPESYKIRFGYKECYGYEAKNYLKNLIEGKKIKLEIDNTQGKKDKYNRLLGYIIYNGVNINNKLIEEGYAWEYTYNNIYKYQRLFKNSEKKASENLKGLWSSNTCNGKRLKIDELKSNNGNITNSLPNRINYTHNYIKGKRGGCYYINNKGKSTYVEHSYCN